VGTAILTADRFCEEPDASATLVVSQDADIGVPVERHRRFRSMSMVMTLTETSFTRPDHSRTPASGLALASSLRMLVSTR
jgi:hypothetical protein